METALILARTLHFAVAMLLCGAAMLRAGAFPPATLRATSDLAIRSGRTLAAANLVTALAWLFATAASVGDGAADAVNPAVIWPLLRQTHFGQVWLVHLMLALALLALARPDRPRLLAVLAGANLASLGWIGHAVLPGGQMSLLHEAISSLHLLAAGYWLGGLAVVLPCLHYMAKPETAVPASQILRSFSRAGHLAVALVFATGFAKTLLIATARGAINPAPDYFGLLALKILAVCAMLGLALLNRYRFVPRLATDARQTAIRDLRRGTLAELALAAVVLVLVSTFALWSPFAAS